LPPLIITISLTLALSVFLFYRYALKRHAAPLIDWLYSEGRFFTFVLRFLRFSFAYILIYLILLATAVGVGKFPNPILFNIGRTVLTISSVFVFALNVVFLAGLIVIVFQALLLLLSSLIRFAEFITWKIVEYNKGAVAAITGLLTLALGMITAVFHIRSG
jgi:hypothetical protein